ncbi:hypothetical protein [Agrobacterium vitis]|uniref:hypothetical protein n=1 Tax=Agrobacterium vitis TaxID=373 RepID=UPI003D287A7D
MATIDPPSDAIGLAGLVVVDSLLTLTGFVMSNLWIVMVAARSSPRILQFDEQPRNRCRANHPMSQSISAMS